jgi:hypothetical protein
MTFSKIVEKLRIEALNSILLNKHACVAVIKGKAISPTMHNHRRVFIQGYKCGSAHAEMLVMNHLLKLFCKIKYSKKQICIFDILYKKGLNMKYKKIIKKMYKTFKKINLVIIKQSHTGSDLGMSRPCNMCLNMMQTLKIKNIIYTDSYGEFIVEKVSSMKSTHDSQMTLHMKTL